MNQERSSESTHPGFIVMCEKCGSTDVQVEGQFTTGQGEAWFYVNLRCRNCWEFVCLYNDEKKGTGIEGDLW